MSRIFELQLDRVRVRADVTMQRRMRDASLAASEAALAEVESELVRARAEAVGELRDDRLARRLGLTATEIDLIWSVIAATVDPSFALHLRAIAGGEARKGISLATYAILAGLDAEPARALALQLTPVHPLIRYGVLIASGDSVIAARTFSVAPRVAAHFAGDDDIDEVIARFGGIVDARPDVHFDDAQLGCVLRISRALEADDPVLVLIDGALDVGKRTGASLAASAIGRQVVQIDLTRLPSDIGELEQALIALRRECLLSGTLPLIAQLDELSNENDARMRVVARFAEETPIPLIATSSQAGLDVRTQRRIMRIAMPVPVVGARAIHWRRELGETSGVEIELLAHRYRLGAGGIMRAADAARMIAGNSPLTTHHAIEGVRNGIAERLGGLAQRVEVTQRWEDLVLSPDTADEINALVARVRHGHRVHEEWGFGAKLPRGIGTAGLFSGPPGTGKTMVAGLIARALDLELYQVDLSKVVSKWVGETEKQLARIFDAADAGHALLLFDEADSLFAKRTEVKAAIDRYANLEVNYLLQRIESFGGISILTTNFDTSIDPALRRRLAAHIVFEPPEHDERVTLWQRLLACKAPRANDIDFDALAREFPDMTGANIRNSVLSAAFLAAAENRAITQSHLRRAGKGEYRAMGRVQRSGVAA